MVNKFGQTPLDIAIQETTSTVSLVKSQKVFKADKIVEMNKRRIDKSDYTSVGDINLEGNLNLAPEKARFLIDKMGSFGPECSLKYVKKPQRLALKFEKSFTMAVKKNKTEIFELFPKYSVKTVYVSTH
jgi:predicted aconitase